MTNIELIQKIKAEIERRYNKHKYSTAITEMVYAEEDEQILSFLSTLESEKLMKQEKEVKSCHRTRKKLAEWSKTPEGRLAYEKVAQEMRNKIAITNNPEELENPMQEGLEEEIERYLPKIPENPYNEELRVFARHFAEWGAEHYLKLELLAKFAEITGLIDTMPKNTLSPSKECEKGLREPLVSDDLKEAARNYTDSSDWSIGENLEHIDRAFIAGYNLCKDQMMKEAVDGEVSAVILHKHGDEVHYAITYPEGKSPHSITDKVRIIIVKENQPN